MPFAGEAINRDINKNKLRHIHHMQLPYAMCTCNVDTATRSMCNTKRTRAQAQIKPIEWLVLLHSINCVAILRYISFAYSIWLCTVHCYTSYTGRCARVGHALETSSKCFVKCVVQLCGENRWIASTCATQIHENTHTQALRAHNIRTQRLDCALAAPNDSKRARLCVCATRFGYFCENTDLSKTSLGRLFYLVRVCIVCSV